MIAVTRQKLNSPRDFVDYSLTARLRARPEFKILVAIVGALAVLVMDGFVRQQGSAEAALHDETVLRNIDSADHVDSIAVLIQESTRPLPLIGASLGAEFLTVDVAAAFALFSGDDLAAVGTSEGQVPALIEPRRPALPRAKPLARSRDKVGGLAQEFALTPLASDWRESLSLRSASEHSRALTRAEASGRAASGERQFAFLANQFAHSTAPSDPHRLLHNRSLTSTVTAVKEILSCR